MFGRALSSALMGAAVGSLGAIASSMISVGRMPPKANVVGAASFMGVVLGAGSMVRGR
jgi:hypothetical protein